MPRNRVRERLNDLYQKIVVEHRISVSTDPETQHDVPEDQLQRFSIRRVSFDLVEIMQNAATNLAQNPPILFQSMPQEELDKHPISLSLDGMTVEEQAEALEDHEDAMKFWEYDPSRDDIPGWRDSFRATHILQYTLYWATSFERPTLDTPGFGYLLPHRHLQRVEHPNPFFADGGIGGFGGPDTSQDSVQASFYSGFYIEPSQVQGKRVHPHITIGIHSPVNGRNGSILYGELSAILQAMHKRANQRQFEDKALEDADEDLYARSEELQLEKLPREFASERRFPVMMFSYLGSQHARIYYACMDGEQLVIQQSTLYNFQRRNEALLDLFARIMLSQPLEEAVV